MRPARSHSCTSCRDLRTIRHSNPEPGRINELLDAQYDTSKQVAGGDVTPYFEMFTKASARARERIGGRLDVRYGDHERETIDFFPATKPGSPLFVFYHGGYWRRMSKDVFSFVAPPLVDAGAAVAVVNYPLAPQATLDEIVRSARRAYSYAVESASPLNADRTRTFAGGHSAGAQLAAMVASEFEVRGVLALSGLYDLEPLRYTHVNDDVRMDYSTACRNSPILNEPMGNPSLVIAAGGLEQQAFLNQQRAYAGAWRKWSHDANVVDAAKHNHFTIVFELADAATPISTQLRKLLSL